MLTRYGLPINFIFNCSHIQFLMCRKQFWNSLVAYCWYVSFSHKTFFLCKVKKLSSIHFLQSMNFRFKFAKGTSFTLRQQYWLNFSETMETFNVYLSACHTSICIYFNSYKYSGIPNLLTEDNHYIIIWIIHRWKPMFFDYISFPTL